MRSPMPIEANTSAASESAAQNPFAPINIADAEHLPPVNTLHITDAQPLPPATTHHKCELYLVRHGERLDEAPNAPTPPGWNDRPWWDPPLTTNGHSQARGAAERLKSAHARRLACVYALPTCRTIQTCATHRSSITPEPRPSCPASLNVRRRSPRRAYINSGRCRARHQARPPSHQGGKGWPPANAVKAEDAAALVTPSEAQERPCRPTRRSSARPRLPMPIDPYSEAFSESVERLARKHLGMDEGS